VSQRSNGYFAPTVDCRLIECAPARAEVRARAGGTPDNQAGPQVRAPTVGTQRPGDVAGAPDTVRWRTGLSGVPPDSVRCTRGLQAEHFTFGNSQRRFSIIHQTVRCTTGQCPVPQGRVTLNSPASGIRSAKIHRTFPVHTGLSGEPAEQRLLRAQRSTATH
jgi:hypothetical protein